jgi:predicted Ser/Thr protein kinase
VQPSLPIIGRYHVVDRLAEGGMGTVYLARDPSLDRLVVIKVLRGGLDDTELRERFSREARSISRLRHPNIVTIFEYGDFEGQPFIAMEYVAGETLAEVIKRRAPITLARKLQMMEELCAGMSYAHRARIVHRDLKPLNIMVDSDSGLIKILDFGIARSMEASLTSFTAIIGTPSYMSPEQAQGVRVDHRSDIFSIGVLFFELVSYRRAFNGDSHIAILHKILNEPPPALDQLVPDVPAALVRIIDKALEKDREKRYQDLDAMRSDIAAARDRLSQGAAESVAVVSSSDRESPTTPVSSLERRRALQITQGLEMAGRAMAAHNYDAAVEWCEQVLLLQRAHPQALTLLDAARSALERETSEKHLERARVHLAAHDLTKAEQAVGEALALRSDDASAIALRNEISQVRREQEVANERAAAAAASISRARAALSAGAFDSAVRAATEALAHAPESTEARQLKEQAVAAVAKQNKEHELERRAAEAIHSAEQRFNGGQHAEALEELEQFAPRTPAVTQALENLSRMKDAATRQRQIDEERRREVEAERRRAEHAARDAELKLRLHQGREHMKRRLWSAAVEEFDAVLALDPHHAAAQQLRRMASDAVNDERRLDSEPTVIGFPLTPPVQREATAAVVAEHSVPVVEESLQSEQIRGGAPATKGRKRTAQIGGLALVAAAVIAIGVWTVRRPAAPASSVSVPPTESTPVRPAPAQTSPVPTPPVQTAQQTRPEQAPIAPPAPPPPPDIPPAREPATPPESPSRGLPPAPAPIDPIAALRPRLRERLTRGDQRGALDVLAQGLSANRNDQEFTSRLDAMLRAAEVDAKGVMANAARVEAAKLGLPQFAEGQKKLDEAASRASAGDRVEATRAYWAAAELLEASRVRAAAALEAAKAQSAQLPPAAPQPVAPVQAPSVPPPAVVQAPPAPTPQPGPPQPATVDEHASDRQAIEQLLNKYEAAWSSLDAAAVRRLDPRAPKSLDSTFETYRSLNAVLANRQFNYQGDTATVTCIRVVDGVSKRGNTRQPTLSTPMTFRFRRFGGSWALVESR